MLEPAEPYGADEQVFKTLMKFFATKPFKRTDKDITNLLKLVPKIKDLEQLNKNHGQKFMIHFFKRALLVEYPMDTLIQSVDSIYEKIYFLLHGVVRCSNQTDHITQHEIGSDLNTIRDKYIRRKKQTLRRITRQQGIDIDKLETTFVQPGHIFGDLQGNISIYAYTALNDCTLVQYTRQDMRQYELSCIEAEKRERFNFITHHPAFALINQEFIFKITPLLRPLYFVRNEIVYNEGDLCESLYFVRKGEFTLRKKLGSEKEYDSDYLFVYKKSKQAWIEISTLQEGEMFGNEEAEGQSYRIYQVKCSSLKGALYSLNLSQLVSLFNTLEMKIDINQLFLTSTQAFKNTIYKERVTQMKKMKDQSTYISQQQSKTIHQLQKFGRKDASSEKLKTEDNDWLIAKQLARNTPIEMTFFKQSVPGKRTIRNVSTDRERSESVNIADSLSNQLISKQTVLEKKQNKSQLREQEQLLEHINQIKMHINYAKNPQERFTIKAKANNSDRNISQSTPPQRKNYSPKQIEELPFQGFSTDYFSKIMIMKKLGIKRHAGKPKTQFDLSSVIMNELNQKLQESYYT